MLATLPDALADALGRVVSDVRREARAEIETIKALHRAEFAEFQARTADKIAELSATVVAVVRAAEDAMLRVKDGKDGRDGEPGPQGLQGRPGVDYDPAIMAKMIDERVAKIELPRGEKGDAGERGPEGPQGEQGPAGQSIAPAEIEVMVIDEVDRRMAELVVPAGEKGEPGPAGADGKDADLNFIAARIDMRVKQAIEMLPPPEKGERGEKGDCGAVGPQGERGETGADGMPGERGTPGERGEKGDPGEQGPQGEPGQSIDPASIEELIAFDIKRQMADLVIPKGEKGDPGEPGPDVDYDLILRLIEDQVKSIPQPKDGVGVAGALIDRDGSLALTLTDGTVKHLGVVVGRDGEPGKPGKDGINGLSIEDLSLEYDGERTLTVRFARGDVVKEFQVQLPIVLDRGVYREGSAYTKGDGVTYGGSFWICQKDSPEGKPDAGNGSWRLAVKHGNHGKDGKPGEKGERGPDGRPGKDFTFSGKP